MLIEQLCLSPYKSLKINKWFVLLVTIVSLLIFLGVKKVIAPEKVEAESQPISVVSISTSQTVSSTSTSSLEIPPLLLKIAHCESGNKAHAKNPHSSASGRFQFIKSSWEYYGRELWGSKWTEKDVFKWEENTELALYVYKRNGVSDWLESSKCWS